MSFLKVLGKAALPFVAFNKVLIKPAFGLLLPNTPKLQTQTAAEQLTSIASQNNAAKLGEPQTILYGETDFFPTLSSAPWFEYVDNQQRLYQRMRVSVGVVEMLTLYLGKTPFSAFPGSRAELCLPGQAMTLFHPNVYTAQELSGLELAAGIFVSRTYTGEIVFAGNRIGVPMDAASVAARAAAGVSPFAGVGRTNDVVVSGSALNDGIYEVTGFDGSAPVDYIDTDHAFTAETVTASITYGSYEVRNTSAPSVVAVTLTFDATRSTISAAPTDDSDRPLSIFQPGSDSITVTLGGAGANEYDPFQVLGINADGSLIVFPPPASGTGVCNVHLLRRYHGPFPVCPPGDRVIDVAYDLQWPQGIGSKNGTRDLTMRFDPQYQVIDDAGTPIGGWLSFPEISITAASRKPVRRSYKRSLPGPLRVQTRLAQTTIDSSDDAIIDAVQWMGARGFVVPRNGERPEVDEDSTTLNVMLLGTSQFAANSDQKVNGRFRRWLETYDQATNTWLPESPTRAVVWAALDKLRGRYTMRGRQIPDDEIDLPGFLALHAIAEPRGDQFNGQLGVTSNLFDNTNLILRLARAEVVYRWQDYRISVFRDQPSAPVQMFCDLNSKLSDYEVRLRTDNDPTGTQGSYQELAFNDEGLIGIGDTDNLPIKIDLRNGSTSRDQTWREINFEDLRRRLRNQDFSLDTELEALLMSRGDRVLVQCRSRDWGQCAQVAHQVSPRLLLIWPVPDWSGTGHRVYLRSPEGVPGAPIACGRGDSDRELLLEADANVEITGDLFLEERTLLILARDGDEPVISIINGVGWTTASDGLGETATSSLTIDDDRVHTPPGPTPVDPFAPVINPPSLRIDGLDATDNGDGTVSAAWDDNPASLLDELDWHYAGELGWTSVQRSPLTAATFPVTMSGEIELRVRALGSGGAVGAYSYKALTVVIGAAGPEPMTANIVPIVLRSTTTGRTGSTEFCGGDIRGGEPPYLIQWVRDSGTLTIQSATSIETVFNAVGLAVGEVREGVFRRRVTDSVGTVVFSNAVNARITQTGGGGTPGGGHTSV